MWNADSDSRGCRCARCSAQATAQSCLSVLSEAGTGMSCNNWMEHLDCILVHADVTTQYLIAATATVDGGCWSRMLGCKAGFCVSIAQAGCDHDKESIQVAIDFPCLSASLHLVALYCPLLQQTAKQSSTMPPPLVCIACSAVRGEMQTRRPLSPLELSPATSPSSQERCMYARDGLRPWTDKCHSFGHGRGCKPVCEKCA